MAPSDLSIGQLAERTGVAVDTLRDGSGATASSPRPGPNGGHRRYGLESVQRVRWLLERVEAGHRVGAAAAALETALPSGHAGPGAPPSPGAGSGGGRRGTSRPWNSTMDARFSGLPLIEALELTVFPALADLGMLWEEQGTAIAAEHLLTEATVRRLAERLSATVATGGTLVHRLLPGQRMARPRGARVRGLAHCRWLGRRLPGRERADSAGRGYGPAPEGSVRDRRLHPSSGRHRHP